MRVETKVLLASLSIIGFAAACGSRSGMDLADYSDLFDDGSSDGTGGRVIVDGGQGGAGGTSGGGSGGMGGGGEDASIPPDASLPDASVDGAGGGGTGGAPQDASSDKVDIFDAIPPLPDGPVGDCVSCLETECGDLINGCYNDPTCVSGIQCTFTECLLGGGGGAGGGGGSGGGGGQIDFACIMGCFDNDFGSMMTAIGMFQCITSNCGDTCGLGGLGGGGSAGSSAYSSPSPFGIWEPRTYRRRTHYIGSTRVPAPSEVACCYPWLVDVLEGRMPDPLPPSMSGKK